MTVLLNLQRFCNCWVCASLLPTGGCCFMFVAHGTAAATAACACLCHHHYCLMYYAGAVLPLLMSNETPNYFKVQAFKMNVVGRGSGAEATVAQTIAQVSSIIDSITNPQDLIKEVIKWDALTYNSGIFSFQVRSPPRLSIPSLSIGSSYIPSYAGNEKIEGNRMEGRRECSRCGQQEQTVLGDGSGEGTVPQFRPGISHCVCFQFLQLSEDGRRRVPGAGQDQHYARPRQVGPNLNPKPLT